MPYPQVREVLSCANLEVGRLAAGNFYPKCRLGGAVFASAVPIEDVDQPEAM